MNRILVSRKEAVMETLSIIALIGIYIWLDVHPFERPKTVTQHKDPQLN